MKRSVLSIALLCAVCLLISWGFKGHQAVATIAGNHLTPEARAAVKELLGSQTLSDVAAWADEVRDDPAYKQTSGWHFINMPLGLDYEQFSKAVKELGENNLYGAMQKARIVLTHPKSTKEQKIEALKFLVHFIGDAHQPMHVSRAEDKGGNTIQVRFDNKGTNLHTLWDSRLIDHGGLSVTEISRDYDKANAAEIRQWQKDQPMQWLYESYEISSRLYSEVEKSNQLDEDYYKSHIDIIAKRIDQGGIRLAGVLNDIFGGKVYSYTFPPPVMVAGTQHMQTEQNGPAKAVELKDLAGHMNEEVTVTAKVYGTKDLGSMVLVNTGAAYPDSPLTVVLRNEAKGLSSGIDGKTIKVTGKLIDYKGKPEIVVTDARQVQVL